MTLRNLLKKISGKTVAEPRRQTNWDFPIKQYVLTMSVYTAPEEEPTPALLWVPMEGGTR